MRRAIVLAGTALLILMLAPSAASAATITVTYTPDEFGTGGFCALREAVQAANTDADFGGCTRTGTGSKDVILLEAGETYSRSRAGIDDTNENGDLDITGNTVFKVVGAGVVTIDANDLDRVIHVLSTGKLKASKLVLRDGLIESPAPGIGAGILNQGRLNLATSTVTLNDITSNHTCSCGAGVAAYGNDTVNTALNRVTVTINTGSINFGGGIAYVDGNLKIVKSTITENFAPSAGGVYLGNSDDDERARIIGTTVADNRAVGGVFDGKGGGLYIDGAKPKLTNVTISGNRANENGGGIYSALAAPKLNAVTITDNVADYDSNATGTGGGVYGLASLQLRNSIIDRNFGAATATEDCSGDPDVAHGHNLIGSGTGCREAGNFIAPNPRLGDLADNGGPTLTHALKVGSLAIGNAGNSAPGKDQRGHRRDADPDIGAYER